MKKPVKIFLQLFLVVALALAFLAWEHKPNRQGPNYLEPGMER